MYMYHLLFWNSSTTKPHLSHILQDHSTQALSHDCYKHVHLMGIACYTPITLYGQVCGQQSIPNPHTPSYNPLKFHNLLMTAPPSRHLFSSPMPTPILAAYTCLYLSLASPLHPSSFHKPCLLLSLLPAPCLLPTSLVVFTIPSPFSPHVPILPLPLALLLSTWLFPCCPPSFLPLPPYTRFWPSARRSMTTHTDILYAKNLSQYTDQLP